MSHYKWNAEDYGRNSQGQQMWARELIGKLSLKGTEKILDLGCGDGKVTAEIACSVSEGSVTGIDSSRSMIGLAEEKHPPELYPNLSFRLMNAGRLSFEECFDVVFSNAALHWVINQKSVVEGIFRSLKTTGKILLQMGGKGNARYILATLDEILSEPEWRPYFRNFEFPFVFPDTLDYETLLSESGFIVKRVELIPKDMEHAGRRGLEGWIRSAWLPYIQQVPDNKRKRFIEEITMRYIEHVPMDLNGKVHVAMVRLEVEAEKIT
jgi:trans-aconitate methyltransferase